MSNVDTARLLRTYLKDAGYDCSHIQNKDKPEFVFFKVFLCRRLTDAVIHIRETQIEVVIHSVWTTISHKYFETDLHVPSSLESISQFLADARNATILRRG